MKRLLIAAAAAAMSTALPALAQTVSNPTFVNGLTLSGGARDLSTGSDFDFRVGYFSDSGNGLFKRHVFGLAWKRPPALG